METTKIVTEPARPAATVLVLDDDPSLAEMLRSVLEREGYLPIETHSGRAALGIIEDREVDVALVDLKLGDMPGLEVLRKIKKSSPTTEVIVLTGYASQEVAIEAMNDGSFGFLLKPCDLEQLLFMVRRAAEKRDALEALREREQHTRAILHSSLDAVVTIDELGTVVDWNPRAEATLGWSRREALGRELWSLLYGSQTETKPEGWEAPAELAMLNRPTEVRLRHKDGRELEVEWVMTKVEVAGRRTFTFFIKDLTARKRLEEQFLKAQRTETVSLLAGGVLHDFNNVLTAVMGQSAILKQDSALTPEHQQIAQEVLDAAQRASVLTRQLLAYSEPQVRRVEPLDVNAVIVDMSRLLKRVLGERILLEKRLAADLPPVEIDRSEIQQVILNLVLNSRDALSEGGTVGIETTFLEATGGSSPRVEIKVSDNGVGMKRMARIRAFEPFFTTKDMGGGVGLGLTTAKSLVETNSGSITLESQPGEGTTCRIELPARELTAITSSDRSSRELGAPGDGSGGETILLVEDEAMVRSSLVRVLERDGYEVLEEAGGEEALAAASAHDGAIDLLLTDVVMPHMSGNELAQELLAVRPETKVLFISGYTDDHLLNDGTLGRPVQLLPKPFTPRELSAKVREILDGVSAG